MGRKYRLLGAPVQSVVQSRIYWMTDGGAGRHRRSALSAWMRDWTAWMRSLRQADSSRSTRRTRRLQNTPASTIIASLPAHGGWSSMDGIWSSVTIAQAIGLAPIFAGCFYPGPSRNRPEHAGFEFPQMLGRRRLTDVEFGGDVRDGRSSRIPVIPEFDGCLENLPLSAC